MIHIKKILDRLTNRLNINKETQKYEVSLFIDKITEKLFQKKIDIELLGIKEKTLVLKPSRSGLKNEIYLRKEEVLELINAKFNLFLKDIKFKN